MAQLREFYKKEVIPSLTRQFVYDNPMRVPRVTKVVLNMGLGEAVADKKVVLNSHARRLIGRAPDCSKRGPICQGTGLRLDLLHNYSGRNEP